MMNMIKVEQVNLNAKCWVVRPGTGYKYTSQFIEGGFIAIGHLDDVVLGNNSERIKYKDRTDLYLGIPELEKMSVNVKTQVESFILDMNIGDVVFTLTNRLIIPGVIKGGVYFDPLPIRVFREKKEAFSIRRTVEWGSPIDRKEMPIQFSRSLLAQQTVFSLGDYSRDVYHWLSSFFITKDGYYSSLRIEQKEDINHHALKSLSEVIDRIQVVSLMYENAKGELDITLDEIRVQMEIMADAGMLTLTSQQMLMSPGDFWLGLKTPSKKSGVLFILLMAMIVNDDMNVAFADENYKDEVSVAKQLVEKHGDTIKQNININKIKEQLKLKARKQNNKFVEANPNDFSDEDKPKDIPPQISSE